MMIALEKMVRRDLDQRKEIERLNNQINWMLDQCECGKIMPLYGECEEQLTMLDELDSSVKQ